MDMFDLTSEWDETCGFGHFVGSRFNYIPLEMPTDFSDRFDIEKNDSHGPLKEKKRSRPFALLDSRLRN